MSNLSERLAEILRRGRYMSRLAREAGYSASNVTNLLARGGMDAPAHHNRTFTRAVAAGAAMRLADSLAADTEALRQWAADALEVDARMTDNNKPTGGGVR